MRKPVRGHPAFRLLAALIATLNIIELFEGLQQPAPSPLMALHIVIAGIAIALAVMPGSIITKILK